MGAGSAQHVCRSSRKNVVGVDGYRLEHVGASEKGLEVQWVWTILCETWSLHDVPHQGQPLGHIAGQRGREWLAGAGRLWDNS